MDLRGWLENREEEIAARWLRELRLAPEGRGGEEGHHMTEVVTLLVAFLPACFGDSRERATELWDQATHLYGSLALRRGLVAGEVVEELHLLRSVILRMYLMDFVPRSSQEGSGESRSHMEFFSLNRILDQGVTQASVSYMDDLFFTHLQGSGVPAGIDGEVVGEVVRQLRGFRDELKPARGSDE